MSTTAGGLVGDRYLLGEQLGLGGMGRVYRARDRVLDRDVAIKLLDEGLCEDSDLERACADEARAAARLAHPGIAAVLDSGRHDGRMFVVVELVPGRPLDRVLHDGPRPAPLEAAEIAARVADALEYAHLRGVVHCDVKPQNIIVTPDGQPKLVDFGIARIMSTTGSPAPEEIRGSAPYVAPEQVRGERVDGRADVYALGAVLYQLLTGRPPFQGPTVAAIVAQHLAGAPPAPRTLNPNVSPGLERVVLAALARDPADRYARAGELRDALREVGSADRAAAQARTERVEPLAPTAVLERGCRFIRPSRAFAGKAAIAAAAAAILAAGILLALALLGPSARSDPTIPQADTPPATPLPPEPTLPPTPPSRGGGTDTPSAPASTPPLPAGTNGQGDQGRGNQPKVDERSREEQKKAEERAREEQKKAEERAREVQKKAGERDKRVGRD